MEAIVKISGKQYRVAEGQRLTVDRLSTSVGEELAFDEVLLLSDGTRAAVGVPVVAGAAVIARVVAAPRGPKLLVYKYKAKKRYRRMRGARAEQSLLEIVSVTDHSDRPRATRADKPVETRIEKVAEPEAERLAATAGKPLPNKAGKPAEAKQQQPAPAKPQRAAQAKAEKGGETKTDKASKTTAQRAPKTRATKPAETKADKPIEKPGRPKSAKTASQKKPAVKPKKE